MTFSAIGGLRQASFTTPKKVLQGAFRGRFYAFPYPTQTARSVQKLAGKGISNLPLRSHRSFPPHIRLMSSCSQAPQSDARPISVLSSAQGNSSGNRWTRVAFVGVAGGGAYIYSDPLPEEENGIGLFPNPKDGTIERTEPLDILERHLADAGCVVITGDSYAGKTQLALTFAKRNAEEYSRRTYISLAHPHKPLEELVEVEKLAEDGWISWLAQKEDTWLAQGIKSILIQKALEESLGRVKIKGPISIELPTRDPTESVKYSIDLPDRMKSGAALPDWMKSGAASSMAKHNITRAVLPKFWNYIKPKPKKTELVFQKSEVGENSFYEQMSLAQDKPLLIIFDNIGEGVEIEDALRKLPYQQNVRGKRPLHVIVVSQSPQFVPAFPSLDLSQHLLSDEEIIRILNQKDFTKWDERVIEELLQECRTSGFSSERQQTEKSLIERTVELFSKKKDPEQEKLDRQLKRQTIIDIVRSCKGSLLLVDMMEAILQKQPQTLFLDNPNKILERAFQEVQSHPDALSLLNTCVYLPAEHIPLECLGPETANALQVLEQFSLVNYDEKAGISIANSVREMVCENVREKKEESKWLSQAGLTVENFPEHFEIYPERVARHRGRVIALQQNELEQSLVTLGERAIQRKDFSSAIEYLQECFYRFGFIHDLENLPLEKLMNHMNAASLLGEAYLFSDNPSKDDIEAAIKCFSYTSVIFNRIAQIDKEVVKREFKLVGKLHFHLALAQKMQGNTEESFQLFLNYLSMMQDFLEGIKLGIKEELSEKDPFDVVNVLVEIFQKLDPLPSMFAEAVEHAISLGEELEETIKVDELSELKKSTKYIPLVKEFLEIIFVPFIQERRLAEFIRIPMRKPQEFAELEKYFPALEHLAGFFEVPITDFDRIAVLFEKLPEDLQQEYPWLRFRLIPQLIRDLPLIEDNPDIGEAIVEEMSLRDPGRKEFFSRWMQAVMSDNKEEAKNIQQEYIKDAEDFKEIIQVGLESAIFVFQKKREALLVKPASESAEIENANENEKSGEVS